MSPSSNWMLYGANGYTGKAIAVEAVRRGERPVLAGRNGPVIEALGRDLQCPTRVFPLVSPHLIGRHLDGIGAVLHCAGPFAKTAEPMIDACIDRGVHYLDITGEIDVIELAHARHAQAASAGVTVMPAVGMDVVPSDCLAARLATALPGAVRLELAFTANWSLSRGTARTIWLHLAQGGRIRRDGKIVSVPIAWKAREVPFPGGTRWAMTIPWGDVASAYYTTGIPTIEVYAAMPLGRLKLARRLRWLAPLSAFGPVQAAGRWWIDRRVRGPREEDRAGGRTEFWGRVTDAHGRAAQGALETPNGYRLTVETALALLDEVLADRIRPGFQTPAKALGAEFIERIPNVKLYEIRRCDDAPGREP